MRTQPLAAAEADLSRIIDEVHATHERVTVTRDGVPVAVILAVDDHESLVETLAVLSDPAVVAAVRAAERDVAAGRVHDADDVRAALAARRTRAARSDAYP